LQINFVDSDTSIADTSPGLQYDVPTGEAHEWRVANGNIIQIDLNGVKWVKSFTDATRPTPASAGSGAVIYNTDDGGLNLSDGSNWRAPSGGWVNT